MDIYNGTPKLDIFHIAGRDASEYLSENLIDFMSSTESYFSINKKFRETIVAPTKGVTSEQSQRLQVRIIPVQTQDAEQTYTARFTIAVGEGRVLDMGSTYFDIRGIVDRGPSFKPYSGTAYNSLAPKSAVFNNVKTVSIGGTNTSVLTAQAPHLYSINTGDNGCTAATTTAATFSGTVPNPGGGDIEQTFSSNEGGAGRVVNAQQDTGVYGAYAQPVNEAGNQNTAAVTSKFTNAGKGGNVTCTSAFAVETVGLTYPDTRVVAYDDDTGDVTRLGNRINYIGFRDNFVGLMYYDNGAHSGTLATETGDINIVEPLQDRNTEISYQYMLADLMSRHHYFAMWNQAVDDYELGVRVLSNHGYEEAMPALSFNTTGMGNYGGAALLSGQQVTINSNAATAVANSKALIGFGAVPSMEMNLGAQLARSWLFANVAEYMPDDLKVSVNVPQRYPQPGTNTSSYNYKNLRLPNVNLIDLFTQIGGRYSLSFMDNVNPFNHHKNRGLKYRSELLGNGRIAKFHIQVPQKFFAIKKLLLLPGTYTYEWWFRKDPNMVLQSSLGNDLRLDGATIQYTSINLFASFFPMDHATCNDLILMLRNETNDQSFMDYMGGKNNLYVVPPNTENLQIEIPSRTWEAFRGWSFNRLKTAETPSVWSTYDVNFKYSGSIPYLDGSFYLSHTFKNIAINFDSAVPWPGNDRMLVPNYFEIKRTGPDSEGYCVAQSNMTKDWFLVQMSGNYNQGYHGYSFPVDKTYRQYDFISNFDPMSIQMPDYTQQNIYDLLTAATSATGRDIIRNNTGFTANRLNPSVSDHTGHPYPCNWPYPLIGSQAVASVTHRKFLCDKYLWNIPFSSNFMNMGELTDLGQSLLYTNSSHSIQISIELEPMNETTYVYMIFGVFDAVRVNQPNKNSVSAAYFRTPFATGTASA
ncbi:hexon [Frog adenovirus 1]|uniref:Hexon protein n=1 Tax=Frog adenovirus 1 (strain ATCC VR-896) TaxID=114102 RepID=Q9IIH5_ADEF1|nr:hexon [Frog adenovirus 1]AAF86932.1 hexon [Frog adenovirus 1]